MEYVGRELESFAHANHWKSYVAAKLGPYISGDVAEVGAGLGETARTLRRVTRAGTWLCLEPDGAMADQLSQAAAQGELGGDVEIFNGVLGDIPPEPRFDTVLYVDVLEHIFDDHEELCRAAERVRPGGRIVVLGPAFPFLYSPFDAAIGHHRRYTRTMLRALTPARTRVAGSFYLDCVGMLASAANRLALRRGMPTLGQIKTWDRVMVPLSRIFDPLVGHRFGRSVVMVWAKP